jgi:hypothetical protein
VDGDLAGPGVFGIPQRWILVAATSASFVLCNMDKARAARTGADAGACRCAVAPVSSVCLPTHPLR